MTDCHACALAIIFRAGWSVRNENTLFDYIFQKENLTSDSGKILAGWLYKYGNIRHGGYTPDLNDVPGSLIQHFAQRLFVKHPSISFSHKTLLAASILSKIFHSI